MHPYCENKTLLNLWRSSVTNEVIVYQLRLRIFRLIKLQTARKQMNQDQYVAAGIRETSVILHHLSNDSANCTRVLECLIDTVLSTLRTPNSVFTSCCCMVYFHISLVTGNKVCRYMSLPTPRCCKHIIYECHSCHINAFLKSV